MQWSEVTRRQPRLAALGKQRLLDPGVVLVVTMRRDGSARLSPVEPWVMDGEFLLSMLWGSHKAADLLRDPRVLVHSIVTARDGGEGELKVRGRAEVTESRDVQERYAVEVGEQLGWRPVPGRFHLFRLAIEHVAFLRYDDATGDQHVASWPPGKEYVRPGTSATSLGDPVPRHDLVLPDDG